MARKIKQTDTLSRQEWLNLGIEERAQRLRNQNLLENHGGSRTGSRRYKRNEKRITRALLNMRKNSTLAKRGIERRNASRAKDISPAKLRESFANDINKQKGLVVK